MWLPQFVSAAIVPLFGPMIAFDYPAEFQYI